MNWYHTLQRQLLQRQLVFLSCLLGIAIAPSAQANSYLPTSLDGKYGNISGTQLTSNSPATHPTTHIVITIGNGDRNTCGSGFNLSRVSIQDGFDFPKPGSGRSSDFPSPSRSYSSLGYPAPLGATRAFQLPTGAQSPDVVGCVDSHQNILYLTIHPRILYKQTPAELPQPSYTPNYPLQVPPQLEKPNSTFPGQNLPGQNLPGQKGKD
ncbi:MAG: hypothetical protein VKJ24_04755 [Synechococcales bacterium]|nr:hypothetical protein [Synechococcales bacterium]